MKQWIDRIEEREKGEKEEEEYKRKVIQGHGGRTREGKRTFHLPP
jgi:hypothetical protein